MGKGNNMVPNAHFHKWWQRHIRTWFNQPARKFRRRQNRIKKAKEIFPRPSAGPLRPVVRCPTVRYHTKVRAGRGFTAAELKGAGLTSGFAKTIGIAVDRRRRNKSVEQRQINIQRLKEYRNKLILFPIHEKRKLQKGEAPPETCKLATQVKRKVMPIRNPKPTVTVRAITNRERKFSAFKTMKKARSDARLVGIRAKKAREASENPEDISKVPATKEPKKAKK
ncbi:large ribosomal subunit protein eL13 [Phlebotomus argentipes]|uniref:large ribosomal subunit protein eL13 n=1 Tax=Phlebotomus argentipes TaxID=94469 RepID=UPI0028938154|nr:large ribosomal subunit protein eL13 [Phlebotomus argentipes]